MAVEESEDDSAPALLSLHCLGREQMCPGDKLKSRHFNKVFLLTLAWLLHLEIFDQWGRGPSLC